MLRTYPYFDSLIRDNTVSFIEGDSITLTVDMFNADSPLELGGYNFEAVLMSSIKEVIGTFKVTRIVGDNNAIYLQCSYQAIGLLQPEKYKPIKESAVYLVNIQAKNDFLLDVINFPSIPVFLFRRNNGS